jgi:hypothetical protein
MTRNLVFGVLTLLAQYSVATTTPALSSDECSDETCTVKLLQRGLFERKTLASQCEPAAACDPDFGSIAINNLDGVDPKLPAVLRYASVCTVHCAPVDLVITRTGPYSTGKPWKNGKYGKLGMISLDAGSSVNLTFTFVKPGTMDIVALDSIYFSMLDMDSWILGDVAQQHESVAVSGYTKYVVSSDTSIKIDDKGPMTTFTSSSSGGVVDNPHDPMVLRAPQAAKTVTFTFKHRSSFNAILSIVGPNTYGQRNFMFAGQSQLVSTCPVPSPAESCSAPVSCDVKFQEIVNNNLMGEGEDATLRYSQVCISDCQKLDLLVSKTTKYSSDKAYKNGVMGSMGMINVNTGTSLGLKFTFVKEKTSTPVKVDSFFFSVFDIDGWIDKSGSLLQKEMVTVGNFDKYYVTKDTQLEIAPAAGGTSFTSKASGGLADNPKDPLMLDASQAAKTAGFLFLNKDAFSVTFEALGPYIYGTRNFLFGGRSSLTECASSDTVVSK